MCVRYSPQSEQSKNPRARLTRETLEAIIRAHMRNAWGGTEYELVVDEGDDETDASVYLNVYYPASDRRRPFRPAMLIGWNDFPAPLPARDRRAILAEIDDMVDRTR